MKTRSARRTFVAKLEKETDEEIFRVLRMASMDELCAMNEFASRRGGLSANRWKKRVEELAR